MLSIYKAALYALHQHTVASLGGSRGMPSVNLITSSMPQSISLDTIVKWEKLDSFYVQMIEKFVTLSQSIAAISAQLQQTHTAPTAMAMFTSPL